jgi:hypothetical protein
MTPDQRRTEPQGCVAFILFFGAVAACMWLFCRVIELMGFRSEAEREALKTHPAVRAGAWLAVGIAGLALIKLTLETLQLTVWFIGWARSW